jgi:hypothetical protein
MLKYEPGHHLLIVILSNPEVLIQSLLCRIPLAFILGFYVSQVISRWW